MSNFRRSLLSKKSEDSGYKGLKFTSSRSTTVSLTNNDGNAPDVKYSLDGGTTWIQWDYGLITLHNGDKLCFKGNNLNGFSSSLSIYSNFVFGGTGTISASGNIMSLLDDGECALTSIPNNYCFHNLFDSCSSLTSAPELPATTLTLSCYLSMFYGCKSLTSAPELPATTLVSLCYYGMFSGCSRLNYIKCLATTGINQNNSTLSWIYSVASSGTFIKDPNATWPTGNSGIPSTWYTEANVVEYNPTETFTPAGYVTFTAQQQDVWFGLAKKSPYLLMYVSKNGTNWMVMLVKKPIMLNNNETVYVCGNLTADNTSSNYTQFGIIGKTNASGNCNALWNYNDLNASLKQYCGSYLFRDCTSLTTAPELPSTTLALCCYSSMFRDCTSLTTAPELPATTLANGCYSSMFSECTALTFVSDLLAEILTQSCYNSMFYGCTSLINAPDILATVVSSYCCRSMFSNCTSLISGPSTLSANTLALLCYAEMFFGCTSLTTAPELPATTLAEECYRFMFTKCESLTTAPELPATTLPKNCYYYMFNGCASLNYIKCLATSGTGYNSSGNWVYNVSSTGTFVKPSSASWPSGTSGIPSGWTVQNI